MSTLVTPITSTRRPRDVRGLLSNFGWMVLTEGIIQAIILFIIVCVYIGIDNRLCRC